GVAEDGPGAGAASAHDRDGRPRAAAGTTAPTHRAADADAPQGPTTPQEPTTPFETSADSRGGAAAATGAHRAAPSEEGSGLEQPLDEQTLSERVDEGDDDTEHDPRIQDTGRPDR